MYHLSLPADDPVEVEHLRKSLRNQMAHFMKSGVNFHIDEFYEGTRVNFLCYSRRKLGQQGDRRLRLSLGAAVADYLMTCKGPKLIRSMITRQYRYPSKDEYDQIEGYATDLLHGDSNPNEYRGQVRRETISRHVAKYLTENHLLAVDGFIRFRMKTFYRSLEKLVEHAIDDYLLDQEYKEFIHLLRYFVSVQSPKITMIHIFHKGKGQFYLTKADGTSVNPSEFDTAVHDFIEQAISQEDVIVSTLLTVAPERIVLHSQDHEENVIRTLTQIFDDRIIVCEGCSECSFRTNDDGKA